MPDIYRPPVHMIQYGDSMAGKSAAAAMFPYPNIVLLTDLPGKEVPYLKSGDVREVDGGLEVWEADGDEEFLAIRIERYNDLDPEHPVAWANLRKRVTNLAREMDQWATVTLDSFTFAEIIARYESQFRLNPNSKEPRQHYAYSTEELERIVMVRLGSLPCNVVVNMHIDEVVVQDASHMGGVNVVVKDTINGIRLASAAAPGRLRKRMPAGFNCLVRTYTTVSLDGKRIHLWQGQADATYNAGSNILDLPSVMDADYNALWEAA